MKKLSISVLLLSALLGSAQSSKRPDNWFNLDPTTDKVNGVSTEKTYNELLKNKKSTTVIVGVLDSGVDFDHEDLKSVMWTNPGEIAGNGIDDDKNGYIDDIHGWNFLGGKDGKNVSDDNLEMTRLMRKLMPKYDGKTVADFTSKADKEEFAFYQKLKEDYTKTKEKYEGAFNNYNTAYVALQALSKKIKEEQKVENITLSEVEKFSSTDKTELRGKAIATNIFKNNPTANFAEAVEGLKEAVDQFRSMVEYGLNMDFNPRSIVGDDYNNSSERYYGNADCNGPDSFHGTHVAGIIAASRKNGVGMDGIAADVRIMAVRCVPGGDEHDKDVANAIRYAVDNGASILNMSFGKHYAWDKKAVDEAVKYAQSKGVLIIHAAGNDNLNIDEESNYPCKKFASGGSAKNFMDVGALSWEPNEKIVASFSNYGKKSVDIFSPGVDIYSTTPKNGYKDASGTSMASPVTAGVAAVLKSYYPTLTGEQIKKILIKSSLKTYKGQKVIKPGTDAELIKFEKLGGNAGVVNLFEAVKMAETFTKTKT